MRSVALLALAFALVAGCTSFAPAPASAPAPAPASSPYAPDADRPIKALSAQEVDDLLQGRGMGLAKAAELNSYPGPLHALDMAEHIGLSEEQQRDLQQVRSEMLSEAVPLGERIVAMEKDLDALFARDVATEERVEELTASIGALEGQLRAVHLRAHVVTKALLTVEQVAKYDAMRGYAEGGEGDGAHGHG